MTSKDITLTLIVSYALLTGLFGFYFGQNMMYKSLHSDKIECRLTADEFFEGNTLGE